MGIAGAIESLYSEKIDDALDDDIGAWNFAYAHSLLWVREASGLPLLRRR